MNSKKIISLILSSTLVVGLTLNINVMTAKADTSSINMTSTASDYLTRDAFYDLNDQSVNRMSSEHFQIIWGNSDKTGTVNSSLVEGNLENLENIRDFYINIMGLDDPGISVNTPGSTAKYKTNLYIANTGLSNITDDWAYMSADEGGFGYIVVDPGAMRVDPPSWVLPHEYAHVVTMHQRGIIPDAWYETSANWFRDQYLGSSNYKYGNTVYGPDSDFFQPIVLNSDYYFPHMKNYYDAWPFLLYVTENPDNMNGLGLNLMKQLLHNTQNDTTVFHALQRLSGTSYKEMLGGYARRMVTLDFSRQSQYQKYLNELLADSSNYSKIYTTLNNSSDGWLTVPSDRAPMQGGYNIVPLNVDLNSRQIVVNFKGNSTASGADWRVSIVAKTKNGETRYSTMWNNGTNTLDLKGDETAVYLVVCATPDDMLNLTSFDVNYEGTRYPYSVQISTTNNTSDKDDGNSGSITTPDTSSLSNIASKASSTSSFCSDWESLSALNDGYEPTSSGDRNHDVYGNWPQTGTQWVKYTFDKNYTISRCDLYWFKDSGGIDVPSSYKIKYWDGSSWAEVSNTSGLGNSADKYNSTTFSPVTTNSIMVEMNSNGSASTGILEWKVFGQESAETNTPDTPSQNPDSGITDKPVTSSSDVKVEMFNSSRSESTNTISPQIKITNNGTSALDLSKVTIRYYYTEDSTVSQNYWCDWSSLGCENIESNFVYISSAKNNADNYLEISFKDAAGTLAPGSSAYVNGRIAKSDWSNYNQSNDYSFNSSADTYSECSTLPLYINGQLTTGIEP